ncbi:hypothetical protein [Pseudomonas sp. B15(2017)]|uniref:hypothetical protein n=1 Tax=Pseudomonas sp. B15(2017) TaxID=1981744 RepID=UPI002113E0A1|nr:hypothetical protein [Pseudomonas sp. B15(2017)]
MNSIALKALERAQFQQMARDMQMKAARPKPVNVTPIKPGEPLPELVITGPINRVMELEGKRFALDFVQGLGAAIRREPVRTKAIADLTRYAQQQPDSVASGVKIVIDVLKGA